MAREFTYYPFMEYVPSEECLCHWGYKFRARVSGIETSCVTVLNLAMVALFSFS